MAFEGLSEKLNGVFSGLKGKGSLTGFGLRFAHHAQISGWVSDRPLDVDGVSVEVEVLPLEAEHFFESKSGSATQWTVYPYYGRTRSAVALTPYTAAVGEASLTYRFSLPQDIDKVKVHVVTKSTLDFLNVGGFEYVVTIDGADAQTVNFNKTLVDRQPYMYSDYYPAVARRVVEKTVELPVQQKEGGVHTLTLQPKHPGIVFEKIVVDFGGYKPSYLYMDESPVTR